MLCCCSVMSDSVTLMDYSTPGSSQFSSVQLLSHVWLFATCEVQASVCQAPLSSTVSQNLLRFMSVESVILSNHLGLCCCLLSVPSIFPSIKVFSNELFASGGQSVGASASATVLPMNIQGQFPLGLIGLISLLSKGLLRVFFSTTVRSINSSALGHFYCPALTSINDYWKKHSID